MSEILGIDRKEEAKHNAIMYLMHYLGDYYAPANRRSIEDKLHDFFDHQDVVVISKAQYDKYLQLEKLTLERMMLQSNKQVIPE
jgi:hypothetical protein